MKTKHKSRRLRRFLLANKAVSALEYALLTGAIVVGAGTAIVAFEDNISDAIAAIGTELGTAKIDGASTLNTATN